MNGIDRCVWLSIRPGITQAAGHVDDRRAGRVDRAHRRDLLALDQHVGVVLAVGGDHPPALQEQQSAVMGSPSPKNVVGRIFPHRRGPCTDR